MVKNRNESGLTVTDWCKQNRPTIIQTRGNHYDNRDCVILFLLNHNSTTDLIAYASFSVSSLKYKNEEMDIVIPAIVINTFAIDQKYKKSLYAVIINEKYKDGTVYTKTKSCASFCIEYLMHYFDTESAKIGVTHVYLYAERIEPVLKFYKDNTFFPFSSDLKAFGINGGIENCFVRTLRHARHRMFGKKT